MISRDTLFFETSTQPFRNSNWDIFGILFPSRCGLVFTPRFVRNLLSGRNLQCADFTGIIPVFDLFLITGEWYLEVVFESGIYVILILRAVSHSDYAPGS